MPRESNFGTLVVIGLGALALAASKVQGVLNSLLPGGLEVRDDGTIVVGQGRNETLVMIPPIVISPDTSEADLNRFRPTVEASVSPPGFFLVFPEIAQRIEGLGVDIRFRPDSVFLPGLDAIRARNLADALSPAREVLDDGSLRLRFPPILVRF